LVSLCYINTCSLVGTGRCILILQSMDDRMVNRKWCLPRNPAAVIFALLCVAHVMQLGTGSQSLIASNCPDEDWEHDWRTRWNLPEGSKWWNRGSILGEGASNYSANDVYDDAVRLHGVESEVWIVTIRPHGAIQLYAPNYNADGPSEGVQRNRDLHYRTVGMLSYLRSVIRLHRRCHRAHPPLQGSFVVVVNDVLRGGPETHPEPLAPVGQNLSEIFREGHGSSWWPVFSSPLLITSSAVDYRKFGSPDPRCGVPAH